MQAIYFDVDSRAIADLMEIAPNYYLVTRINVPRGSRGKGLASKLLRQVIEDADDEDVTLEIHPMPSGDLTRNELVSWYKRYGFDWTTSRVNPGDPIQVLVRKPR